MTRLIMMLAVFLACILPVTPVKAGGGDGGCYPNWTLEKPSYSCSNSAIISPGNDTRVNMLLLMRDRSTNNLRAIPDPGWDEALGNNFFTWELLSKAFYPESKNIRPYNPTDFFGSRCTSYKSGTRDFNMAVSKARKISANDRRALLNARESLLSVCQRDKSWRFRTRAEQKRDSPKFTNPQLEGKRGLPFVAYLNGAAAFYRDDFERAQKFFDGLVSTKNKWLREAATYMKARNELNMAQKGAFGRWGDLDRRNVKRQALQKAEKSFDSYLRNYPQGRYAASARGLKRRLWWLGGDNQRLSAEYMRIANTSDIENEQVARIIEETDNRLFFEDSNDPTRDGISEPAIMAVLLLFEMRKNRWDANRQVTLSRSELNALAPKFATAPKLFSFLQATHAYYVSGNMREVLELVPDDARQQNFSYLDFSRQALRGMALAALKDRNEAGFWKDMLNGSKAVYQRQAIELGLALNHERTGKIDAIFTQNSPITESMLRNRLLMYSADIDLLRRQATNGGGKKERNTALFTLLYKTLSNRQYSAFLKAQAAISNDANVNGSFWALDHGGEIPVGLFIKGRLSEGYPCAPLRRSISALAKNPRDPKALLCLGDFWRLNGFDNFHGFEQRASYQRKFDAKPWQGELGTLKSLFPSKGVNRQAIYKEIIANRRVAANERAYALYRAVYCYAPGGQNTCGGKDTSKAQRKVWFQELKRRYPKSEWAKKLRYYW